MPCTANKRHATQNTVLYRKLLHAVGQALGGGNLCVKAERDNPLDQPHQGSASWDGNDRDHGDMLPSARAHPEMKYLRCLKQ